MEREALVELVALAAVAGEHLLVIGPPGTAKSEAVRRATRALGGTCFEYLLGRFTEPAEIFGPIDLRRLREGVVEVETAGMLPEADIAFLDEVFLGSSAILNTLLGILNERAFRRGSTSLRCPLRVCVGASNALPEDPSLAAFADRFVVRAFIDPVTDPMLEDLLAGGWSVREAPAAQASLRDLDALIAAAREVRHRDPPRAGPGHSHAAPRGRDALGPPRRAHAAPRRRRRRAGFPSGPRHRGRPLAPDHRRAHARGAVRGARGAARPLAAQRERRAHGRGRGGHCESPLARAMRLRWRWPSGCWASRTGWRAKTPGPRGRCARSRCCREEDFILREKITHFDHERIPERIVHARGSAAHGFFECYDAAHGRHAVPTVFSHKGKKTPVFVRFSTVAGERGSDGHGARRARLRGEVLHRRGQLRPRRQQHPGLLHPGRDEVPRPRCTP